MNDVLKKLQIKEEMHIFYDDILNIPYDTFDLYDGILLYVDSKRMLKDKIDMYLKQLKEDGLLWIIFPKAQGQKLEIRRDSGFEYLGSLGYEPVRNISYSENLSALRFRHKDFIKKLSRKGSMRLSDMMGGNHVK
jgi:hypothetical protein